MTMNIPHVAIVNDQPPSSGTGTYVWHLAELVRRSDAVAGDHVSLEGVTFLNQLDSHFRVF